MTDQKLAKRQLKVYKGHYVRGYRHVYVPHPVIRIGGLYLEEFNFKIGDTLEVNVEDGLITISKVNP